MKDSTRQSKQLEELTDKMRDCKRLFVFFFELLIRKHYSCDHIYFYSCLMLSPQVGQGF